MDSQLKYLPDGFRMPPTATEHSLSISGKILTDEDTRPALKQWRETSNSQEHPSESINENPPEKAASSSSIQPSEEVPKQKIISPENTTPYVSKSGSVSKNNSLFFNEAFSSEQ